MYLIAIKHQTYFQRILCVSLTGEYKMKVNKIQICIYLYSSHLYSVILSCFKYIYIVKWREYK